MTVLGALYLSSWFIDQTIRSRAQHEIDDTISELNSHLSTIEELSSSRLETALTLLRRQAAPEDRIDWSSQNDLQSTVNHVQLLTGARVSVFQKKDLQFVRIATTIPNIDGHHAIGTRLDPSNAAYAALLSGLRFHGAVYILDQPYITTYEPVTDVAETEVIGALFVGFPLTSLRPVTEAINRRKILQRGFAALLDNKGVIVACSESISSADVKKILDGQPRRGWNIAFHTFLPWNYKIVAAYPEADVDGLIRSSNIAIGVVGLLLVSVLAGSQYYLFYRKVSQPILQIHERAMSIAQGNLDHAPLPVESYNEITDLKSAINEMEKSLRGRREIETALISARLAVKHDHLTGVLNRVGIEDALTREFARYLRSQEDFSVLMIDIDHFKSINDTHGHLMGDEVLKQLSERMASMLRLEDVLGRFGGEEFLVVAPRCGLKDAAILGERIRNEVAKLPLVRDFVVTVSIGIASSELTPRDTTALVQEADKAMYRAKQSGRNRVELASPESVLEAVAKLTQHR